MVSIKKSLPFLLGLILSLSLLWPLFAAPFFKHHDDLSVIRLYEMNRCFEDGQIPCRWVPDLGGLYGYPLFNFYGPLPYYFGTLIYFFSGSLLISIKIMLAFSFVGSYIFMYLFAKRYWGQLGGSLSAIFYIFAPYHALDFYVRGAMGEMWGLLFFPALLWAVSRLFEKANIVNTLLCALFMAGLLTSHNLSAMLFVPITFLWVAFLFFQKKSIRFLWLSLTGAILGVFLSSFYLFPMLYEKDLVHVETTTYGYFSYTEHFKGFKKLLLERSWEYGQSVREVPGGERDTLSYQIGWIHLLGWVLALFAAYKLWRKNKSLSWTILISSAFAAFSIFLVNPRSQFIWDLIEPLKYLQFPWRFLTIIIFFISFATGSFIYFTQRKKLYLVLVMLIVGFNFWYFKPEKFSYVGDEYFLTGENYLVQTRRAIFDYLPIFATEPPGETAAHRYEILTGDTNVSDFENGTDWFKFKAETKKHTIIRISQYYFPYWKILIDGKESKVEYTNNSLGLMTIILGEGKHFIEGRLFDTPIRIVANMITLGSMLIFILLLIFQFKKIKSWIEYYRKRIS